MNCPLAFDLSFNPVQMVILGAIAVLLFGKRLPEVGRSLGKGIAEFRKGLRGIEEAFRDATSSADFSSSHGYGYEAPSYEVDDLAEPTAPKFEPPPEPMEQPVQTSDPDVPVAESDTPGTNQEQPQATSAVAEQP